MTALPADALAALQAALGPRALQLPADYAGRAHADASRMPCAEPLALLRPDSTEEVVAALRVCHAHRIAVVPQGGLTGLAGGACLLGGEVALSLDRLRGIDAIDPVSATMTVRAGTPLQTVQEAADAAGFLFALDLGARGSASIGGAVATNAGGNRVIKYGTMREQVLDVEAVLADGSVVGGRHRMIKNNTGYDLRQLLVGSEGTLGVVTRAVLRLRPKPGAVATAFCGLPGFDAVTTLLARAQARLPGGVSAFEVMWPGYVEFYLSRLPALRRPLAGRHAYYVLLETEGVDPAHHADDVEAFLGAMLEDGTLDDAALAASDADARAFWALRDAPAENARVLPGRVSFDIGFAIADVGAAAARCEAALRARWPAATVNVYGHLGDGNIHLAVQQPDWPASAPREAQDVVYAIVGEMGGTVSAEHGIGTKRRHVLTLTRSAAEIACMRAIKSALDPLGILNPGKVL